MRRAIIVVYVPRHLKGYAIAQNRRYLVSWVARTSSKPSLNLNYGCGAVDLETDQSICHRGREWGQTPPGGEAVSMLYTKAAMDP